MSVPPLSILLVEADRDTREDRCADLEERGCVVTPAATPAEGLEAIVLGRFDVVVSDLLRRSRGGLWLWREATALRPELRRRFVFCGSGPVFDRDEVLEQESFLITPVSPATLWRAVLLAVHGPQLQNHRSSSA
ncbi:MAG: hypothetical protein DMD46_02940 [Gemmatimonadetes bacterium]|nr:MAG: hypothetical protein DMD46_02940 [Gemmatimonadota bacterium]